MEKVKPDPLVSMIVPVYNVEGYLKVCLDSIISQTYTNIEIIIVDDGSTDSSSAICDEYAKRDSRVQVIHQANKGLSAARNIAIDRCRGEYVSFIDSDDIIAEDYTEYLINGIRQYDVQISCCNFSRIDEYGRECHKHKKYSQGVYVGKEKCMEAYLGEEGIETMAWAKIYHRSIFEKVRFPEGRYYEDIATMYKIIDRCESAVVLEDYKYFYRNRSGSITSQKFEIKHFDGITAAEERKKFIGKEYPELLWLLKNSIPRRISISMKRMMSDPDCPDEYWHIMTSYCRKYFFENIRNVKGKKVKALLICGSISSKLTVKAAVFFKKAVGKIKKLNVQDKSIGRMIKDHIAGRNTNRKIKATYGANKVFSTWDESIKANGKIAVYTCLYGDYDNLLEPEAVPENVDYIVFTDADVPEESVWKKREICFDGALSNLSAQRKSRYAKILPHRVLSDYEYSVYVDANLKIKNDISVYIKAIGKVPIAFSWHWARNCLYKEARACAILKKEQPEILEQQILKYKEAGMPEEFGMTENSCIVRKHMDQECIKLMEMWWDEFIQSSKRDQISLPYVIWKSGHTMNDFGFLRTNMRDNEDFSILKHIER